MLSPLPTLLRRDSPFARRCKPDSDSLGAADGKSLFFCLGGGGGFGLGVAACGSTAGGDTGRGGGGGLGRAAFGAAIGRSGIEAPSELDAAGAGAAVDATAEDGASLRTDLPPS